MGDQRHTPGPWTILPMEDDEPCREFSIRDEHGSEITSIEWSNNPEADAHLVAASPDLLEALKAITERLEIALEKSGVNEPPEDYYDHP